MINLYNQSVKGRIRRLFQRLKTKTKKKKRDCTIATLGPPHVASLEIQTLS